MNFHTIHSFLLITIFCLFTVSSNAQGKEENIIKEASFLILRDKIDSALIVLNQSTDISVSVSQQRSLISQLAKNEKLSSAEYCDFFRGVLKYYDLNYFDLYDAYKRLVNEPKSKTIDLNYVEILWLVSSRIRNDGNLDLGNTVQKDLDAYVDKFKGNGKDVQKARVIASFNSLVMLTIQRNSDEGLKKSEELIKVATKIKDTDLIIATKYYKCEFLILQGNLQEFIRISRECYELDKNQTKKSDFYVDNLIHLCDALIYQKGNSKEVLDLLNEMYNQPEAKVHSYSLYAKLLSLDSPDISRIGQVVFDKFDVSNIVEFTNGIFRESEEVLSPNNQYYVLLEGSRALSQFGEPEVALETMNKAVSLNKLIYSSELANSLANHKTEKIRLESEANLKTNQLKVDNERLQSKIYIGTAVIVFIFLCIAIIALWKQRAQSRLLKLRNEEISEKNITLEKQDKEKTLLVKEIHHRVKNNFQIVSSLLELQTQGIEDKRALELAVEGQKRVRSMAIIHQKLYQRDDLKIRLEDYMNELIFEIHSTYAHKKVEVDLTVDPTIDLDLDTAIPFGLIVNELVTNAFKYGFPSDRENKLTVGVSNEGDFYSLEVSDNGDGIVRKKTEGIGLHLVKRLTKQLMGAFSCENENGGKFTVIFKDTAMRFN